MLNNHNMPDTGESSAMYDALMAVKPDGLSLNQWASRAGINRSIFNAIKAHGNPTSKTLDKLLSAIGVSRSDFETGQSTVRTEVRGTGMTPREVQEATAMRDAKRLPILGTAYGTELDELDGVETTELMLSEVLDYIPRPASLVNDDQAYAVTVIGDSQSPRFEAGEIAVISPKAPINVGDDVLVQLRDTNHDDEGSQLAGRVTLVLLKRLVKRTGSYIELRQFNPDKTFKVPIERVRRIHRVKGRL
jgi:phage repressor protein C with HTH and peptisase S24 domain